MSRDRESYNAYLNSYMKERYRKRRATAVAERGGKCCRCGAEEKLEFHHTDPSTKVASIARASSFSEVRWQDELSKCDLLCRDCHLEEHASLA